MVRLTCISKCIPSEHYLFDLFLKFLHIILFKPKCIVSGYISKALAVLLNSKIDFFGKLIAKVKCLGRTIAIFCTHDGVLDY